MQLKRRLPKIHPIIFITAISLIGLWLQWAVTTPNIDQLFLSHSGFLFLGVCGAIFANATGAGGGVIFIPAFSALGFSPAEAITTSFLIQCFGMTAGAMTWCHYYLKQHHQDDSWQGFPILVACCALFSISGLWISQYAALSAPVSLHVSFSVFSIALGAIIIVNSLKNISSHSLTTFKTSPVNDCIMLSGLSFLGGIITAWLSVGVGEIIVIYLMLRGYCTKLAIATGVVVSAMTVWSATPITLSADSVANFEVLLFAGPGALLGGLIAKRIALFFSVIKLKIFFALWIMLTGLVMIAVA
ncbi:sulfite exporter TauE/SafE family protein [Shewanella holmiensis]|uniref:Probable membrane transporter protein n=1 Tax=Shewanella holmiensis TaxID=2952222 RepID=A0A9X2WL49_9GAMM|nr:sulfite exporter TauE/SafE family protein [Shewanella holmiensis]MCT7941189.1 sulfite exporter TauE/SafE family protein [Shewanella holmiensis]